MQREQHESVEGVQTFAKTGPKLALVVEFDAQQDQDAAADEKRGEVDDKIEQTEEDIETRYDETEREAEREVEEAEEKARQEKEEKENESDDESWWDRATSWLQDQLDKLQEAINAVFDAAADYAKKVVKAAAAALEAGLNAVLDVYQGALNAAFAAANAALSMSFTHLAMMLLEAAVSAAGVDPQGFMALIDKAKGSIMAIVEEDDQVRARIESYVR